MGAKKRKLSRDPTPLSAFAALGVHHVQKFGQPQHVHRKDSFVPSRAAQAAEDRPVTPTHVGVQENNGFEAGENTKLFDSSAADDEEKKLSYNRRRLRLQRLQEKISDARLRSPATQKSSYLIRRGEFLFVVGEYNFVVKEGLVRIYGALFRPEDTATPVHINASAIHAIPSIEGVADTSTIYMPSKSYILHHRAHVRRLACLLPSLRQKWPAFEPHENAQLKQIWTAHDKDRSADFMYRPIDLENWQQTLSRICNTRANGPIVQICGSVGRGKATFARHVINGMLTQNADESRASYARVLLLDLDFSKQEFSPPGQISLYEVLSPLLDPPYHQMAYATGTHSTLRAHSVSIGGYETDHKHFSICLSNLLACARRLQTVALSEGYSLPLIVKCSAWISGEQDILKEVTRMIRPTQIVCLNMWKQILGEDGRTFHLEGVREPAVAALEDMSQKPGFMLSFPMAHPWILDPTPCSLQPAQLQEIQLLSYFHHAVDGDGEICWNPEPLIMQHPLLLSYDQPGPDFGCFHIPHILSTMHENIISNILTGKIVSIVVLEDDAKEFDEREILRGQGDGLPYLGPDPKTKHCSPLDPETSHTIGLGLIKAIDPVDRVVQMYTGTACSVLEQHDLRRAVLVLDSSLPTGWAYEEHLHYNQVVSEDDKVAVGMATPWVADF